MKSHRQVISHYSVITQHKASPALMSHGGVFRPLTVRNQSDIIEPALSGCSVPVCSPCVYVLCCAVLLRSPEKWTRSRASLGCHKSRAGEQTMGTNMDFRKKDHGRVYSIEKRLLLAPLTPNVLEVD